MIHFFKVSKRFGERIALDEVTFVIPKGQFVFLTGPSGAGKTTLLRLIYRAELPTEGQILVNGRNLNSIPRRKVPFLRRTIGVVFQEFSLIERRTVFENVSYLPRILGRTRREQRRLAEASLSRVGLADYMDSLPAELSGGEQQRVAIARALINRPDILIADEPTGNLDPQLSAEILRLFFEVNRDGTTVLLATHDPSLERRSGDRILSLAGGAVVVDHVLPAASGPATESGTP